MQPPGKPPGKRSQLPLGQGPDSFLDVAGALPALDEVLLPGDRRPPAPPPVDDDPVDMEELAELESRMAKFASGVSVANKRHEIRKLTAPAEGTARSRLTLGEEEPAAPLPLARTQKVLAEDDTADRLSAFAEKVAVRAKDPRFMALAKEGAKQAIIDNLNPVIAISANLAEAGMRANALRDWNNLSDGERVLQVAGLAGNVAEILSAVTPPPAGPAFKALGIGMVLIKIAAEANTPKKEKVVPQAPPARRGTQMLRAPGAPTAMPRSPTGALTPPPQPPLPPRPVSKTGPLTLPTPAVQPPRPVAKTGPLPALPEEAPKDERAFVEKLKAFGKQLKDFF